ncbi:MAG: DMT family transporter [Lachnospiraceae bacterium]
MKAGIILGAFLFSGFALQTVGLQYTTLSKNAFLTATNVVIVPFIAFVIYKKKMSPQGVAGAIVAVIGAGVLSLNESFSLGVGDTLTLACAVCFAFQIFLTGEYVKRYSVMALNFFQIATAFVMSAVGLLCTKGTVNIQANTDGILAVVYLGVGSTTITYLLQTVSQRYVDETKSAVILSMEAVFGTIFSIILLHEMVTIKMIIGCALIFGAVLISEVKIKGKNDCFSVKMFTN